MNTAQARHCKSIARHIREHAERIVRSMAAIEQSNLSDVPLDVIEGKFSEIPADLEDIQQVLDDMLPDLEGQE